MSGLEFNKIAGAVLTAAVLAWSAFFVAELLTGEDHEVAEHAYPVGGMATATTAPEAGESGGLEPVLPLLAAADTEVGAKLARKCSACHSFDDGGPNKIGPNLWDIVDRAVAGSGGFAFSGALQDRSGDTWSYQNLNAFLAKPKDWAPGTKMSFAGLKKVGERAAIIAYLRTLSAAPAPLPGADEPATAEPAAEEAAPEEAAPEETMTEAPSDEAPSDEAAETQAAETQVAAGPSLGALLAGASAEDGQKVARKCKACHTFEQGGANKIGPNLWGVVGRSIAGTGGFKYSSGMAGMSDQAWSYENLDAFLAQPKGWVPGTKMAFAGLKKPADRAALIAYLRAQHDDPPPLPE